MLSDAELDRYARQIILPAFGGAGQAKLKGAHVAIIGAGGIGCPAITYLAAAGVGKLSIIDHDVIELSNLQRQPLFTDADIGARKADVAAGAARRINPHVDAIAVAERLDSSNAETLLAGASLILDGCDNFGTRLAANRAAVALHIPLLSAAIGAFEGQVALYEGWRAECACYACLVGSDPDREGTNCAETGVMGALAGMIGTMAALETVRALTGLGSSLTGRLAIVDMLDRRWREVGVPKDPLCPVCRA
ncbi:molybdopterin biosynthesis protein MoeB [Sphingopyxis sp. H038]|uniref:HesA/MoeB/ThiF family protein n=1 Tax=unclassified Sphingopyxis TaxID=2614943 RepID=UPI000730CCDC|nr:MULTISPECIES: HesA/MoeB/ThiF family protein [unclassified Sphingopyxis]KTE03693.1 molybdopterin biosynthesis protein MoeB [Sphingopyxis sp. H012]KTE09149.1 molybdopterin biosynthesis protein MoeB [Sphingopyxis sp. H053]KTE14881.1 molybdopterin biosynthesis protein MoeB [Sphingopyxis sp. H093]KTE29268.1 molybdopterin biosynthesis protein MoeB [Sphingopyxis sp. H080]KTE35021.1 molybdopterin biosynthesis protein MoeB [Sphingopyxis sp. H038]